MYLFNDIEYLGQLAQVKILDTIKNNHDISISALKLHDYEAPTRQIINRHSEIKTLHANEHFFTWIHGKRGILTVGDLSSVYIAMSNPNTTIVLSDEDIFMEAEATKHNVSCISVDTFIVTTISDERAIKLYKLLKTA